MRTPGEQVASTLHLFSHAIKLQAKSFCVRLASVPEMHFLILSPSLTHTCSHTPTHTHIHIHSCITMIPLLTCTKKMCWLSIASVVQVFKRFLQTLLLHLCQEKCIFTNWGSTCIINTCTRKSYTAGRDVLALRTASFTSISPLSSSWYCRWG